MRKKGDANDFFGSVSARNWAIASKKACFWLTDAENGFYEKKVKILLFPTGKGRTGVFLNVIFSLLPSPGAPKENQVPFAMKKF